MRILFFLLFIISNVSAQDTGEVCIRTNANALIKIDGQLVESRKLNGNQCITLSSGFHVLEIWAPKYAIFKDTIEIKPNESMVYGKGLISFSKDFENHKIELNKYWVQRNKRITSYVLSGGLSASMLTVALISKLSLEKKWEALKEFENVYNSATNTIIIENAKRDYSDLQQKYNLQKRVGFFLPLAISIGCTFNIGRMIAKNKKDKLDRPVYNPMNPWIQN